MKEGPDRIDYQETGDVTEVHAAVKREHPEPSADTTPMPLWLTAVCGIAVAWAGAYFGIFNGGLSGNVYNEYQSSPAVLFPLPQKDGGGVEVAATLAQQGKSIYAQCVGCHGGTGMGVPNQFPHLAKASFVNGGEKRLIAILLKGITGPLNVDGKQFNNLMPAWESAMPDRKIAAVASFIRQEWGNTAGEITEAKVAAARKEFAKKTGPWTEAELLAIPADENLPEAEGAAPAPATAQAKPAAGAPAVAGAPGATFDLKASVERGKSVYMQTCFACHQATGMGLPGAFPPLAGTDYTTGDVRRMIAMLLAGVNPPLTVNNVVYVAPMPSPLLTFPILKEDGPMADVVNYVRNSFGNKDEKGVTPEFVGTVRKEFATRTTPWTEAELQNFPPPAK
ncbi:MAG: cytochrome c [Chthoniobacteraceae bacterium]